EPTPDETGNKTEVGDLHLASATAAQLEVAGAVTVHEQLEDGDVIRREMRGERRVVPREAIAPVPWSSHGRVKTTILGGRTRFSLDNARRWRKRRAWPKLRGVAQLEVGAHDSDH